MGNNTHVQMNPFNLGILNEDGSCSKEYLDLIPDEDLVRILKTMILNRVFETRMMTLQRQGRLGFMLMSTGEEAITIGSSYCLKQDDPLFLSYRELGSLLWRGVPPEDIMNQLLGNVRDHNKGRQMPVHYCYREYHIPSVSAPVGTQLPHACGYAYASKYLKTGQVSLAFLGEGAASANDFHSAMNFASVFQAPVVYVIRNNGYAISTPESVQTAAESLAIRAEGYGMPGIQIDGTDILLVVKTIREAVHRAREGRGPTLIEALTYRIGAHSSSDDPSRYRPQKEVDQWKAFDDIERTIRHSTWRGIWSHSMTKETQAKAEEQVTRCIKECETYPPPPLDSLFEDVYEKIPNHLHEQKKMYLDYLAKKGEKSAVFSSEE